MPRPLAARWRAHELPELRAGALATARIELENTGETPWRGDRFTVSYHWLDELGNAIVWDGLRTPIAAELGNATLDLDVDVAPRIDEPSDAEARLGTALAADDWAERVFAAHREGYAVVGGSVASRSGILARRLRELGPYTPPGRVPSFAHPLVCASVVKGVEVEWTTVAGLPAAIPPPDEPSLYDGRIRVRLPSGRRRA